MNKAAEGPLHHRARAVDHRVLKFALFALLIFLTFLAPEQTRDVVKGALADAYIQVTSFVALTLIAFYAIENYFRVDTAQLFKKYERWQVPIAALIGAIPGCGGAIIVITQYVLGRISFGSMVAVLTSTMGDAAFLLLAQEPKTAFLVFVVSVIAGSITGMIVDKAHGTEFMRMKENSSWDDFKNRCDEIVTYPRVLLFSWYLLLVPGIILGIAAAFQIDTDIWFGALASWEPTLWIGVCGAFFCYFIWAMLQDKGISMVNLMAHPACHAKVRTRDRVIFETSFVTTWVLLAFLLFELGSHWGSFDLGALFDTAAPLIPLIAVLVGFIPGCGPQIIVTTLYLGGVVPLSAQIANAISNDGDALFPAIALAPRTAVLATLYTGIPALIVGYGFFVFVD